MRNNLNFPQSDDPRVVNPWDLKSCHRYYYYTIGCTQGVEDSLSYVIPTIRSFYLKNPERMKGWWKTNWQVSGFSSYPSHLSPYLLTAGIDDSNSTRLNDSPIVIISPVTSPRDELSILGERQKQEIQIYRGRGSFFSTNKKHFYIYENKKDCILSLIEKVEKIIKDMEKSIEYIVNQLWELKKNILPPVDTKGYKDSIDPGDTIWIAKYEARENNYGIELGSHLFGNLWQCSVLPTPITVIDSIKSWSVRMGSEIIESNDLIGSDYIRLGRVIAGRTKEECMEDYRYEKSRQLSRVLENIKYNKKVQTEKLNKLKKSLEKL